MQPRIPQSDVVGESRQSLSSDLGSGNAEVRVGPWGGKLTVSVGGGGPLSPRLEQDPLGAASKGRCRERRPENMSEVPGREEGSSPGQVLQRKNPSVVTLLLPSGLGAPGSKML